MKSSATDKAIPCGQEQITLDKQKSQNILKTKLVCFAKQYLAQRAYELQKQIGEKSAVVVEVKKVRSWWGCYSVKNKKIKLSARLIAREKTSIDSVIFHEFAHIKVQNHQKAFYKVLLSYCPNYYSFKKALSDIKRILNTALLPTDVLILMLLYTEIGQEQPKQTNIAISKISANKSIFNLLFHIFYYIIMI